MWTHAPEAKPDAGRLAPDTPSNFWASHPNGINQFGCVYTVQGFEFDYVGVIWGRDLTWDPVANAWLGDDASNKDPGLRYRRQPHEPHKADLPGSANPWPPRLLRHCRRQRVPAANPQVDCRGRGSAGDRLAVAVA